MARTKGGRKKDTPNLLRRQRQWDLMSADKQRMTKRPGSNKK